MEWYGAVDNTGHPASPWATLPHRGPAARDPGEPRPGDPGPVGPAPVGPALVGPDPPLRAAVARAMTSGAWGTSPRMARWSRRPSPTTLMKRAATSSGMVGATRAAVRSRATRVARAERTRGG